jgi:2-oxoglutarate dehydrogenase E2 component (dihydrolipoamide succinyltransferase)
MPIDVVMPQMGESIAEGTVSRWLKKVGEKVDRDEPLLEISTDKVDAEIPSPAAGTLSEILVEEGATVPVNSVVARLAADGEAAAPKQEAQEATPSPAPSLRSGAPSPTDAGEGTRDENRDGSLEPSSAGEGARDETPAESPLPAGEGPRSGGEGAGQSEAPSDDENVTSLDERRRTKSSPLVRKIAKENNVDISRIEGTGVSGRVTKNDILDFLQAPAKPAAAASAQPAAAPAAAPAARREAPAQPRVEFAQGEKVRLEPLSMMRKKIAQHMVQSKQTSAHVTTVFEIDFTNIDRLRKKHKEAYAERGVKITYLPFIVHAIITALREFPVLNASMDETNVIYHRDYNIGIAVALDWGLIVPVLKHADELNILGLARAINDLGDRARTKKLSPDDVQGGTFTITNPGIYGGLFGTPIINQPQVAILGVGGVKKRPVVIETEHGDSIAVRSMCYLALTFDHRLIDGAVADQFMARVREIIESGQYAM